MALETLIWTGTHSVFVGHLRAHSDLPGPLSEANALVDKNTRTSMFVVSLKSTGYKAVLKAHTTVHLNAGPLKFHFKITRDQANNIVKNCPLCTESLPHLGITPRGISPNAIWQMDITHVASFGHLQFVQVSVDTYSHLIFASAHTGKRLQDVKSHCLQAFAYMGVPRQLKMDNGPTHTSQGFKSFCTEFSTMHKTCITYNPQGQAMIDRAHGTIKAYLHKTKKGTLPVPLTIIFLLFYIFKFS